MTAIYKRELKAFFSTMIGWIFIAAILFITGIYFLAINLMGASAKVSATINGSLFIYIIAIPILTMRIISEERRQKIDQLILTAPVSIWKIICGKYLAMCTVLMAPILVVCTFPFVLSMYGTVAYGETFVAILGFLLYGMASIAVGLFMSSLTESVVIAAIISFASMFITYMMAGIIGLITISDNAFTSFLAKVLGFVDFGTNFSNLMGGNLDLRAVIFFVLVILVFLYLTTQVIQKRRFTVSRSTIGVGVYNSTMLVVVVAAAVIANVIVKDIPDKYMSIDVTQNKMYSITDTTRDFLANLDKDVNLYVIQSESDKDELIDKTVREYAQSCNHIKYEYKDPIKNPGFYKQYTDENISLNSVIVVCGDKYKVVDTKNIYKSEIDYNTYSYNTTGYDGEGQLTGAINYVTMDNMPVAYNITGHGEGALGENFKEAVRKMNVDLSDVNLLNLDSITDGVQFVLIAAPTSDFSADDAQKVLDYAKNGGKLIVYTSVTDNVSGLPNFKKILDDFGVTVIDGAVVESDAKHYYQNPTYLLPEIKYSTVTSDLYDKKYVFLPYAQGIDIAEDDDLDVDVLLESSDSAKILLDETHESTTAGDAPYDLSAYIKKNYGDKTGRLMIFTSLFMLSDDADSMVSNANSTLFGNCLAEYVDSETGNISIPVKSYQSDALMIDSGMGILYGVIFAVLVPLALLVIGFVIWLRRRKM